MERCALWVDEMSSLGNFAFEKQRFGAIQAIRSFIAYALLSGITALLMTAYASNLVLERPELKTVNFDLTVTLSASITGTLLSLLLIWSLLKKYFNNPLIEIGLIKSSLNWNVAGICIGLVVSQFVNNFVYHDISPSEVEKVNPFKGIESANIVVKLTYVVVVGLMAPFFEEFLFRGVLYRGFSQTLGIPVSMLVVTILFVMSHTLILRLESWPLFATLLFVSIVFMALRQASRSLIPSILLHQAYNTALIFT